ncbi:arylsulfotransferase family protein [Providencia sp. M-27]|uniref:arylsulfotransferase family protein n=1 Tax=Providencia sp. M-27 TaxID=2713150 RepID=UPI00140C4452
MGHPSIYPSGTTIFNKEKTFSGYTLFNAPGKGALLIDMNGREVHLWQGVDGFPNKILPGGYLFGSHGLRSPKYGVQDQVDLVQFDWDGNIIWSFNKLEKIQDPNQEIIWMARQHHDFQRDGNPVGYYSPTLTSQTHSGNTLILCHKNIYKPEISDKWLLDDIFIEVDWQGNIIWQWAFSDHFSELNFSEEARNVLYRDPNMRSTGGGMGDYLHINTMSRIGPNLHYDNGDERFHPDNIIWDSREANIIGITSRKTGKIVWQLGPDYNNKQVHHLGWIIGPHHAHIIPHGLPGAGNLLIFDNGGWAGYGAPNPSSVYGLKNAWRDSSQVLEINPVTLEIIWQHDAEKLGFAAPMDSSRFYSPYVSSAQRLPNGNTLITEGSNGRLIEITAEHEIVWEYVSPYWREGKKRNNMIYRAYRIPYDWIPQLDIPEENSIAPMDVSQFRLPNAAPKDTITGVYIEGIIKHKISDDDILCIARTRDNHPSKKSDTFFFSDNIYEIDSETFDSIINENKNNLIFFGASWCNKCKVLSELLPSLVKRYSINKINYLSVDNSVEILQKYSLRSIPIIAVSNNGKLVDKLVGLQDTTTYVSFLNQYFDKIN